jgi:tetraacyldisaccharide 4'-kinase
LEKPPTRPSSGRLEARLAERGGAVELLRVPAALFGAAALARRAAYDLGLLPVHRLDVPVVSVGNLTAGGTGKTPMCAWIVAELERRGLRPGLLSRGYRAAADGRNEEARLLERLLPGTPHVQSPDRVRGGRELVRRGCLSLVLDDGFQHRRLARDLDLVLVDATQPFGLAPPANGGAPVRALLPRGLLREPPSSLARAHAIVITRASQAEAAEAGEVDRLERELDAIAPGVPRIRADHEPEGLRDERGRFQALASLEGREVDLLSGIGNPRAFEASVRELGARIGEHRAFPDHHAYAHGDLAGLGADGRALVTTAKDAPKLADLGASFLVLDISLRIRSGAGVLEALLDALPPAEASRERAALRAGMHG